MTQPQAVIDAIESLGGIAPLGKIYQVALQNPDCTWGTQTPQASIRRIVRHTKGIYVVRNRRSNECQCQFKRDSAVYALLLPRLIAEGW